MSRIAKAPVELPSGVTVTLNGQTINVKGSKGMIDLHIHENVEISQDENVLRFTPRDGAKQSRALAGTMRSLVNNMVIGVSAGYEKRLELIGVGYRAKASGDVLNLTLGFSHPIDYHLPEGVTAETPKPTEIVLKGVDKQRIGQVAAEIRGYRPPEPYKGKGVRYSDEVVLRKEAKKK